MEELGRVWSPSAPFESRCHPFVAKLVLIQTRPTETPSALQVGGTRPTETPSALQVGGMATAEFRLKVVERDEVLCHRADVGPDRGRVS